jgi:hypothetical protein
MVVPATYKLPKAPNQHIFTSKLATAGYNEKLDKIQSGLKVDTRLHMSSRRFEMSSLENEFIKFLISVQLGDNLFSVT